MSVLWRARVSSFLAGVGVATLACMYQLKSDIDESYSLVLDAVRCHVWFDRDRGTHVTNNSMMQMKVETQGLEKRVQALEKGLQESGKAA